MAEELFIPQLGQTVEQVTIVSWIAKDGDQVEHGQEILEVETDKAVFPIEANANGTLHRGPFQEGAIVPVLTVVALIGSAEDKFELREPGPPVDDPVSRPSTPTKTPTIEEAAAGKVPAYSGERLFISPRARKLALGKKVALKAITPSGYQGLRIVERDILAHLSHRGNATPLAQKIADEAGFDLQHIVGTGAQGTITRSDVLAALGAHATSHSKSATVPVPMPLPEAVLSDSIPLSGIRAIIADRMAASAHSTARVTLVTEVDATEFVRVREDLKTRLSEAWGFSPGYNDLLAMIAADALREFPYLNTRLAEDTIEYLAQVNIGIAVDTERGLLVPVVQDVDQKTLQEIGAELRQMVQRARSGKSRLEDLTSGTFTITNLGPYEIDAFTPVINLPEAAILGVGRIQSKPAVVNGKITVRQLFTLSLTFDHRLMDGGPAARFLQFIKHAIETPDLWEDKLD
jgi:pyruvate dehydrogenase E2 component (dihydrolipoamide acetyltransferase)